ncbi:MAG: polysaccharide biosynthesis/export family protein [Cytophagaceae bacterium]
MFQTESEYHVDSISAILKSAESTYPIQKFDLLEIKIYTNGGERIIDPNSELESRNQVQKIETPKYLVQEDGTVKLPMIGTVNLLGKTLFQADSILQQAYSKFYEEPFVITRFANKRVLVIGPLGSKVVNLENQKINVIEAITIYGGIPENGKAYNIRHIRGDLKNPHVSILDLSTIEGMKKANLQVLPNDIIYIEPVRRIVSESIRDISPLISMITSVLTLLVILSTSRR